MGVIRLRTPLPGPRSRELRQALGEITPRSLLGRVPVVIDRGEGALVTDVDGNTFIDLASGLGVLALGHTAPAPVEAARAQLERYAHTDFSLLPYREWADVGERLARLTPGRFAKKVAFFNSGAEAVENAVKIAKAATGRRAVVAFSGAFHGRTWMALSLTGRVRPYKQGFSPFVPEVYRVPYPYPYRSPTPDDPAQVAQMSLKALEEAFSTQVAPEEVAAIVVEPVLGEGGVVVPPPNFLPGVAALARRHGQVLIADEIQTGLGRTGAWFACAHVGVEPDLVCVGKALGGGLPLAAVVGRAELMDAPGPGALGGTFIGNPVALAAARAVLDTLEEQDACARARELGARMLAVLGALEARSAHVGEVRGLGAMVGVELVADRVRREPAPALCDRVLQRALAGGVIAAPAGLWGQVVRCLPPLTTPLPVLEEALEVLREAILQPDPVDR